jgi:hypothetical protein
LRGRYKSSDRNGRHRHNCDGDIGKPRWSGFVALSLKFRRRARPVAQPFSIWFSDENSCLSARSSQLGDPIPPYLVALTVLRAQGGSGQQALAGTLAMDGTNIIFDRELRVGDACIDEAWRAP